MTAFPPHFFCCFSTLWIFGLHAMVSSVDSTL